MTVKEGQIAFSAGSSSRVRFNDDILPTSADVSAAITNALEETLRELADQL